MTSKKIQRYEWEDALIEAEAMNQLNATAVNVGLRLARAINWNKRGAPAGLYWDNETGARSVNVSRSTLFRGLKPLKAAGFLAEQRGNLIVTLPKSVKTTKENYKEWVKSLKDESQNETPESQNETAQSQNDTDESQNETAQSQNEHPFTVDSFTVDSFSEDSLTVDAYGAAVAVAPAAFLDKEKGGASLILTKEDFAASGGFNLFSYYLKEEDPSLSVEDKESASIVDSEEVPQSQIETGLTIRQRAELAAKERDERWKHPAFMAGAGEDDEW